ncbi:MAG: hypothetical protein WC565_05205 [Parcubacteria group bacterium]
MSTTFVISRDSEGLKAVDLFKTAYDESELDNNRAQRLIERSGKLRDGILKLIAELTQSDRFADEEVHSDYGYPEKYKGPRPIDEQIKTIAEIFGLDPTGALEYVKDLPQLPKSAEGWFAIPTAAAIAAKHFPEVTDPAEAYCRALGLVHAKIAESRSFYNYRDGELTPERLKVFANTAQAQDIIAEKQPGEILIIAAQLGLQHRGRSVRRAREIFAANEFGLTSLAVGSIILVHPERLVRFDELDMDCPGDEFDVPDDSVHFSLAPIFNFNDGQVEFITFCSGSVGAGCGSASGFLPQ